LNQNALLGSENSNIGHPKTALAAKDKNIYWDGFFIWYD
jgi:hypothetical protein